MQHNDSIDGTIYLLRNTVNVCSAHCEGASMSDELTKGQRVCLERGYHDDEEFIDPKSGGFTRCKDCGRDIDREESEEW